MSTRRPEPIRADVAIIGAGIAGLGVARELARAGVDVAVIEARATLGDGASGRDPGVVTAGLTESAFRLEHAIGTARTRELYALATVGREALPEGLPFAEGAAHLAAGARETAELEASLATLERIGVSATLLDAEQSNAHTEGHGFSAGLLVDGDGALCPRALIDALVAEATAYGAAVQAGWRVARVHNHAGGLRLETTGASVDCEVVVFAAGHALRDIDPWFEDKLVPVREHALRTAPLGRELPPARAQLGYVSWRQDAAGRLVLSGCRWATPHLETGETEEVVVDVVIDKLNAFRQRHLPAASAVEVVRTWARIATHTCDGLPVLGPLPGDPTRISCAGFQGLQPALGLACAAGVARGLLTGRSDLPAGLEAGRFV